MSLSMRELKIMDWVDKLKTAEWIIQIRIKTKRIRGGELLQRLKYE